MKDVTVLLPTFEEEEAIGKVIDDVRYFLPKARILVAYTPGKDGTMDVLKTKGVEWVTEPRKGKGNNVRNAIRFIDTRYVVMIDSDFTYPAQYLTKLLTYLSMGYDVVLGYRHYRERGAMTSVNWFGNKCLSLAASIMYRHRVHDVCTGMWGFKKEALDKFILESAGFTLEADMFVNCIRHGCKVKQIPIYYRSRLDGSLPKLRVMDGVRIMYFLVKKRLNWVEDLFLDIIPLARISREKRYRQ